MRRKNKRFPYGIPWPYFEVDWEHYEAAKVAFKAELKQVFYSRKRFSEKKQPGIGRSHHGYFTPEGWELILK